MDKNEPQTQKLIDKFLHGQANENEISQLNSWYHSFEDTEVHLQDISNDDLISTKREMLADIRHDNGISREDLKTNGFLSIAWKVAATIILVAGLSFYLTQTDFVSTYEVTSVTKRTKFGEKSTVTLSDGSVVKLNSGSSIVYAEKFNAGIREIELKGEAFFEVAKDPNRPFKVKTGDVTTIALGTSFNINAYPNKENIDISLATGKVKVESSDYSQKAIDPIFLVPGEKASYNISTLYFKKQKFNTEEMLGWKDGIIYFKNAGEFGLVEKLEKWYGVDIQIMNQAKKTIDVTTKFENPTLENILTSLGYTLGFEYSIDGKKVEIKYLNE